jgi:hypothetical protein
MWFHKKRPNIIIITRNTTRKKPKSIFLAQRPIKTILQEKKSTIVRLTFSLKSPPYFRNLSKAARNLRLFIGQYLKKYCCPVKSD